jgi:membrane protein required for colicin V production
MDKLGITIFDVAVLAVAVFGAALGMSAGFAHSVLFIAAWIGAGFAAVRFSKLVQPEIEQLVGGSTELAYFLSMLVVFVGALIILVIIANTLSRSIKASPLRWPDSILGAGFGVVCAWVAMGAGFLFYTYLGPRQLPPPVEGAATFPLIKEMANLVEPYLPPGFRTRLQQKPNLDAGQTQLPSPADTKPPDTKPPQ